MEELSSVQPGMRTFKATAIVRGPLWNYCPLPLLPNENERFIHQLKIQLDLTIY